MLLITDLDKTIVYSKPEGNDCCVERKGELPVTYMTHNAMCLLNELIETQKFSIIPCTLRSFEQTQRIDFTHNGTLPFIICDNGFSIYRNGVLDEQWDNYVQSIIDTSDVILLYDKINKVIEDKKIPLKMLKNNRNGFISIIFNNEEESNIYAEELLELVDTSKYKIANQGKKIYVIPNQLDKAIAVNYIKELLKSEQIITSGDSSVDTEFTKLGDYIILPKHATFQHQNAIITQNEGIVAGEEILSNIKEIMK